MRSASYISKKCNSGNLASRRARARRAATIDARSVSSCGATGGLPGRCDSRPYWRIAGGAAVRARGRRRRRARSARKGSAGVAAVVLGVGHRCERRSAMTHVAAPAQRCAPATRGGGGRRGRRRRPAGATPRPRPLLRWLPGTSLLRALAPRPAPPPPAPTAALPRLAGAAVHTVVEPRALHAPCRSSSRP